MLRKRIPNRQPLNAITLLARQIQTIRTAARRFSD